MFPLTLHFFVIAAFKDTIFLNSKYVRVNCIVHLVHVFQYFCCLDKELCFMPPFSSLNFRFL